MGFMGERPGEGGGLPAQFDIDGARSNSPLSARNEWGGGRGRGPHGRSASPAESGRIARIPPNTSAGSSKGAGARRSPPAREGSAAGLPATALAHDSIRSRRASRSRRPDPSD